MKKNMLLAFLLFTLLIFASSKAFSAWTQPKGYAYNQLSFSYYVTDEKWTTLGLDDDGEVIDLDVDVEKTDTEKFTSSKISYYSEYGIIDKLTIFFSGGYDWQESDDVKVYSDENGPSGIGDINLGLRYHLKDNILGSGILSSAQVEFKIPVNMMPLLPFCLEKVSARDMPGLMQGTSTVLRIKNMILLHSSHLIRSRFLLVEAILFYHGYQ
jgi:hypothetical protein